MSERFSLPFSNDKQIEIPLESKFWTNRVFVRRLYPFDPNDTSKKAFCKKSFFVTSPSIYNRFFSIAKEEISDIHQQVDKVKLYYQYMLNHRLVKRFDKGTGPIIEVYEII